MNGNEFSPDNNSAGKMNEGKVIGGLLFKADQEFTKPDFVIDSLARCLLPKIQAYFDSPEGKAEFEEWKQQQKHT